MTKKSKTTNNEKIESQEIIDKQLVGKELRTVFMTDDGTVIMSKRSNGGCHGCYWLDSTGDMPCTRSKDLQCRVPCIDCLTHDGKYRIWVEKKGLTKKAKELPTLRKYLEWVASIGVDVQLISLKELDKLNQKYVKGITDERP
jgi:hypothetical protein